MFTPSLVFAYWMRGSMAALILHPADMEAWCQVGKGKTMKRERWGARSSVYRNPQNRALCRTIWTVWTLLDGHLRRSSLWLDLSPGNRDRDGPHSSLSLLFPVERVFFRMRLYVMTSNEMIEPARPFRP